ncbi:MAG TPA: hypothetical protein VE650_06375, partial [Acetobacteraceae bacterium]|nr:hypothetical protein [Acetobacteraceae bacterium]
TPPSAGPSVAPAAVDTPRPAVAVAPAPVPASTPMPTVQPATAEPAAPVKPVGTPPAPTPPANQQIAAVVTPDALRRAVASALQGTACAVAEGDVSRNVGTVVIRGVVGRGQPEQELLRAVRDAARTAAVDWSLGVVEGPYCGVLDLVRSYTRPFGATTGGVEVALRGNRTSLVADDKVEIRAALPDFPSYLQVDYFSSDGSVAHLRTAATGSPVLPARSPQEFFAGEVAPPFGTDLIVAVASSVPLFQKDQALSDRTDTYLRELRAALDRRKPAQVASGVLMVRTSPRS